MKTIEYEKITIENIENLIKSNYITEVVCDADKKTININENELRNIEQLFKEIADKLKPIIDATCEICKRLVNNIELIVNDINCLLNKKITKKKFIKLLQSKGIQRNTINKFVNSNKEPYTYKRLYILYNKLILYVNY